MADKKKRTVTKTVTKKNRVKTKKDGVKSKTRTRVTLDGRTVTKSKTKTPRTGNKGGRGVTKVKTKTTSIPASRKTSHSKAGLVPAKSTTVTKTKRPVGNSLVVKQKKTTTTGKGFVTSGRRKEAKGSLTTSKTRYRAIPLSKRKKK